MARIRIEDLPPVETLTPEEQEEIFGAGRTSFQPTFEALEERQLMAAGLAQSLLPSLIASHNRPDHDMGHIWHGQQHTPGMGSAFLSQDGKSVLSSDANQIGASYGALGQQGLQSQQSVSQVDAERIFNEVSSRYKNQIANNSWNRWMLQGVVQNQSGFTISGTQVTVHLHVGYGAWGDGNPDQAKMDLYYTFADHGNFGGSSVFKIVDVRHTGYKGWFEDSMDSFGKGVMSPQINGVQQYDPNAGKLNHDKAQNDMRDSIKKWLEGTREWGTTVDASFIHPTANGFKLDVQFHTRTEHWEVNTDADFKKFIRGKLSFTFQYAGMNDGHEQYTCMGVDSQLTWNCWANHRPTEYYDANLGDFGTSVEGLKKSFTTTQKDVPMPDQVSKAAYGDAQKVLSGLQFKNFKLVVTEELNGGVRLKIHADRADGKGVDFSVDVKYDGQNGFKCDRVNVDLHGDFAMNDAEASALAALPRDLHGNWR